MRLSLARRQFFTLATPTDVIRGVGLHSGIASCVQLKPSSSHGVHFVRTDLGNRRIDARADLVSSTVLSTTLSTGEASVSTVEHLMAALCGLRVRSCRIEVDAPELPLLDGSAAPWVQEIISAGLVSAPHAGGGEDDSGPIASPVFVEENDSWAVAVPAPTPKLTVGIDFSSHLPIGRQWASWEPPADGSVQESFAEQIAPARTFALAEQVDGLRAQGLIRGGSLDNALVCDKARWLNDSSPRFINEPARHKLLDLMGDLSLIDGALPRANVVTFKAGHRLHVALARAIVEVGQYPTIGSASYSRR
jgi:UDP-3-O-[3-hydroxymyristoyl] N-acetylglucosamine deacetylase